MKSYIINKNDANQRLDKFISKSIPNLPKSLMYKYIRKKRIKINGKKADISTKLNENDIVDFYINDEFFLSKKNDYDFLHANDLTNIVYEDNNIIICDKPSGLLCHSAENEANDTLISQIKKYLYEKNEYSPEKELSFAPALANRIDRNTAGLVIAAKNAESLRILNSKLKTRQINKYYLCVVHGKLKVKSGILKGYLTKDKVKNKVIINDDITGKNICTEYRVIDENSKYSLVEIKLITGRPHQIRAHFASIGNPLVGDIKYQSNSNYNDKYKFQLLYSYKICFNFTDDGGILNYLNHKSFEIESIWFKDKYFNNEL